MPVPLPARLAPWLLWPLYVAMAMLLDRNSAPFPQPDDFHAFADARAWLGIPNIVNVASNLAILVPALLGFGLVQRSTAGSGFASAVERAFALVFFGALIATSLGSAWYHLAPDNDRLLADRLPIAFAFTTLVAWLLAERTRLRAGALTMLIPWLLVGPASVLWWYAGELHGTGDLRYYLLLYGFAFVVPPLLMSLASPYSRRNGYLWAYVAFALAMICDRLDHRIFAVLDGLVSGHTLKHLLIGVALACLVRMLGRRRLRFR